MSETTTETSITLTSEPAPSNPHMPDARDMTHWRCTLRYDGRSMVLPFSQGSGHGGTRPELNSVIDCLCSDAPGADTPFEEWAREWGENPDSRKARATWRAIIKQTAAFKRLLGPATFKAMVYGRSLEDQAVEAAMSGPVSDATVKHTGTERDLRRIRSGRYCTLEVELRADGELSICGQAGRWVAGAELYETGGQIREELAQWFPEVSRWMPWHLNHLKAGCEHQEALGWGHGRDVALSKDDLTPAQRAVLELAAFKSADRKRAKALQDFWAAWKAGRDRRGNWLLLAEALGKGATVDDPRPSLTTDEAGLLEINPRDVAKLSGRFYRETLGKVEALVNARLEREYPVLAVESAVYKDSLMAPCPECGYQYGSAWLKRELPAEIRAEVEAFIATGALPGKGDEGAECGEGCLTHAPTCDGHCDHLDGHRNACQQPRKGGA